MSECAGFAPMCEHGYFHFMPYTIPILLDREAQELPREGVQTGRLAVFDLLAETYWGGFISGDQVDDALGRGLRLRLEGPAYRNRPSRGLPRWKAAMRRSPAQARSRPTTSSWIMS